jgi:hypothetical protein
MPTPRNPQINATELIEALRALGESYFVACVQDMVGAMNSGHETSLSERDVEGFTGAAETLVSAHGEKGQKAADLVRAFVEQYK